MREVHEILLYIAYNLANQNQTITIDALRQPLEWMLKDDVDLEKEMIYLTENGIFFMNTQKEFSLSEIGGKEMYDKGLASRYLYIVEGGAF